MPAFMRMNLSHGIRMERAQEAGTGRLRFLARNRRYFVQGERPLSPMTDRSSFTIGWPVTGYRLPVTSYRPMPYAFASSRDETHLAQCSRDVDVAAQTGADESQGRAADSESILSPGAHAPRLPDALTKAVPQSLD